MWTPSPQSSSSAFSQRAVLAASSTLSLNHLFSLFFCISLIQTDFVTSVTGRIAKKSYVIPHNRPTFEAMRADKSKSHFIEVMSPFERPCYDFSIQVEKAAEAFAVPPFPRFHGRWSRRWTSTASTAR